MTELKYDPDFPFVFRHSSGDRPTARFRNRGDAESFASAYAYGSVIDTTPVKLPKGIGSVITVTGSMPLIKLATDTWVMPMSQREPDCGDKRVAQLCAPLQGNKSFLTDDDVREFIVRKSGNSSNKIEMHESGL